MAELPEWVKWRQFCDASGENCVNVGVRTNGYVHVTDDEHPTADSVVFNREAWNKFVEAVKAGEFDYL